MFSKMRFIVPGLASLAVLFGTVQSALANCTPSVTGDAQQNTCIGSGALGSNLGQGNTAIGYQALFSNISGLYNTAIGHLALYSSYGASFNTAIGEQALFKNTHGEANTAIGYAALWMNTTGPANTAIGGTALSRNTTGHHNTAVGVSSLMVNTIGAHNTATGDNALYSNTTGSENTAHGGAALSNNTIGQANTGVGFFALLYNTEGNNNTALGHGAAAKQKGSNNTSVGFQAGNNGNLNDQIYLTGNTNLALGYRAGTLWGSGSNNVAIAAPGSVSDSGTIRIGVQGRQSKTFIAGIRGVTVTGAVPVLVTASGQLGIATSSRRFKEDIQPMGDASSALMQLKPVTFRYKDADTAGEKPLQYGLIAEDVEEVMPGLVVKDASGQIETVAYHVLPSLLLNEYQKQNRRLVEAEAKLAASEQELATMRAEMAAMKLALGRLASATPQGGTTLASVQADEPLALK